MADIALGNATEADLKALDDEIAKEQKNIQDAQKKLEPLMKQAQAARTTLPGLERKLSSSLEKLELIQSESIEVEHRFYLGVAENIAAEYIQHATQLKTLYMRLAGLSNIVSKLSGNNFMASYQTRAGFCDLVIPVLKLSRFEGMEGNPTERPGVYFSSEFEISADSVLNSAEAEKTRIADTLGVTL